MSDNTNRIAGIAYLTVDGQSYMLSGALSYRVSGRTRETMIGQDGVHGYKETPQSGRISATLRDAGGLSIAQLNQMTNVTVVAELANGKIVVGRNMWAVDSQEGKADDGTVDVAWEGFSVEEA
jgi:hypothetical protein